MNKIVKYIFQASCAIVLVYIILVHLYFLVYGRNIFGRLYGENPKVFRKEDLVSKPNGSGRFEAVRRNNENTSFGINSNQLMLLNPKSSDLTTKRYFVCHNATGRMGNQMFDFAVSLGISHALNYKYVIRPSHPLRNFFEINQTLLTWNLENVMRIPLMKWRNDKWRNEKSYLSFNLTLSGYYRVWRYFQNVSAEVRNSFTIKEQYLNPAKQFLKPYRSENRTIIGVHIRRGDFLTNDSLRFGRVVADEHYISKAMKYYRKHFKDTLFIVVGNDRPWNVENINGNDVIFSKFSKAIIDLALLSLCNHSIITTGTFGWWGGWLCGGTVVYCKDFPKPGSTLAKTILFREEFYPPSWIGMSNGG